MANPVDLLFRPLTKGARNVAVSTGGAREYAGVTLIASGGTTATVSTTVVKSNSIIMLGTQATTRQASGSQRVVEVSTIIDGTSFVVALADGVAVTPIRATNVFWEIVNRG